MNKYLVELPALSRTDVFSILQTNISATLVTPNVDHSESYNECYLGVVPHRTSEDATVDAQAKKLEQEVC